MLSGAGSLRPEFGFSLIELLVAAGLTLVLAASVFTILSRLQGGFEPEEERAEMQQRLRVAASVLQKDLLMAGAGPSRGNRAGPLNCFIASVFPFRRGSRQGDAPGSFRPDAITLVSVLPASTAQTTIARSFAARSGTVAINLDPGCPANDPSCGFSPDTDVVLYDETGSSDTFRVVAAEGSLLRLEHTMPDSAHVYAGGSALAAAVSRTFFTKSVSGDQRVQLTKSDSGRSSAVIVDDVAGLAFEYFGASAPPTLLRPVADPIGPWTTYGPKPPPAGARTSEYPAGENCAFRFNEAAERHVPRLASLGGSEETTEVKLDAGILTDGPWCPDAQDSNRYDADLFRIRRVEIALRVQASAPFRGPAGLLFANGGTSQAPPHWLPDLELRFGVTPRNLSLGRPALQLAATGSN